MKKTMLKLSGLAAIGLLMVGCGSTVDAERLTAVEQTANDALARAESAYQKASNAEQTAQQALSRADEAIEQSEKMLKRATRK